MCIRLSPTARSFNPTYTFSWDFAPASLRILALFPFSLLELGPGTRARGSLRVWPCAASSQRALRDERAIFVGFGRMAASAELAPAVHMIKMLHSCVQLSFPVDQWRRRMGVEPTRDTLQCRATVLKTARPTGTRPPPKRAPRSMAAIITQSHGGGWQCSSAWPASSFTSPRPIL